MPAAETLSGMSSVDRPRKLSCRGSVRCESSKDYKDWTSTIGSLVPPPLSGAPEVDEEGVVKTKKMSIFRKKSTKGM